MTCSWGVRMVVPAPSRAVCMTVILDAKANMVCLAGEIDTLSGPRYDSAGGNGPDRNGLDMWQEAE